ncbi:MAG: hypothetical protein LBR32_08370 [Propionibacteriaceae bacterium]|jgi:DNA gyrase subunit A|nr:hypothetical protein [Propionibacteriaceae bacterium]
MEDRKALEAERARLMARLGEIDAQLRAAELGDALAASGDWGWALLSSTGLIGRWDSPDPLPPTGPRSTHDVIVSAARSTGVVGVLTSAGRIVRVPTHELPDIPVGDHAPNLLGAGMAANLLSLPPGERAIGLTSLGPQTFGWALGTRRGVVKRTNPEIPRGQDSWEVIRLDEGDEVVGAVELRHEQQQLVFVTDDAQLLRYPASAVRPQGRQGGGMVGIRLDADAKVVFFGAADLRDSLVVTNAGRRSAIDSDAGGSLKVTPFDAFPEKGRATGGVRCHRFLKGEDVLYLAWVGPQPAIAATRTGSPSNLPPVDPKRDGTGTPTSLRITGVGTRAWA